MDNEQTVKLRTILPYWIKHNIEHSQEFGEWAKKATEFGEIEAAKELGQAAQAMDKATKSLSSALRSLEKGGR